MGDKPHTARVRDILKSNQAEREIAQTERKHGCIHSYIIVAAAAVWVIYPYTASFGNMSGHE